MINSEQLRGIADREMGEGGLYVYDLDEMAATAQSLQAAELPFGLTVRYAAKANPDHRIVRLFDEQGLSFDASSVAEARKLVYGSHVEAGKVSLSSQVLRNTPDSRSVIARGVLPVATSLRQIDMLGEMASGLGLQNIAPRMNSGEGSGAYQRTNVGGPTSSFGIWKDQLPEVLETAARHGLTIDRIHTHIGSGVDPGAWRRTIQNSLAIVEDCPDSVTTLDIGGGYKIARMEGEPATDMDEVFGVFSEELEGFADRTGREIHLEIEPGTLLVGNAAVLLARVEEVVSTSMYNFIRLNAGMNAILRPAMYGAQHPIEVLNDNEEHEDYVVVGPCCESGDNLTPEPGNPEGIAPRTLKKAEVGDYVAIGGVGAYCASMRAGDYNSIPQPTSVFVGSEA